MGEHGNKAMGKAKRAVGRATGDRDLEGEGRMQEATGKLQGGVRKAGRAVNRGIDKVARKAAEPKRRARPATRSRGSGSKTRLGDRRRRTTMRTTSVDETY